MPRTAQRIKSTPAVLLPRGGKVVLPGTGCTRECKCEPSTLLPALAAEPLLVELWHHDKYTQDVLLGVATIDLSEVLSARPEVDERGKTTHRQEQTVPSLRPMSSRPCRRTHQSVRARATVLTGRCHHLEPAAVTTAAAAAAAVAAANDDALRRRAAGRSRRIYPLKAGSMTNQKAATHTRRCLPGARRLRHTTERRGREFGRVAQARGGEVPPAAQGEGGGGAEAIVEGVGAA